jgi:hypothetical protein
MNGPAQSNPVTAAEKPALGPLALETYRRNLSRLLEERRGQWVAYHGDQLVGFAKTDLELYQECDRRGYRGRDYVIEYIEFDLPGGPDDIIDSPYPFD